jgi:hypothetical protein
VTRKKSRAEGRGSGGAGEQRPAEALLTAAQRRTVIALSAERMRIVESMDEVMEALKDVAQVAGMVGEGPWDFVQRGEGMYVVVSSPPPSPPPSPPRSGGGGEMGGSS